MVEGRDNVGVSERLSENKPSAAMIAFVQALARACAARDDRMMNGAEGINRSSKAAGRS